MSRETVYSMGPKVDFCEFHLDAVSFSVIKVAKSWMNVIEDVSWLNS